MGEDRNMASAIIGASGGDMEVANIVAGTLATHQERMANDPEYRADVEARAHGRATE